MEEKNMGEKMKTRLPGDKVLHIRRRRPRRRLRITPNIPGVLRVVRDVVTHTPLIPLLFVLILLWLLASWGIYLAEHNANEQISSYPNALWWSFTAMQTQGANAPGPITTDGMTVGAFWSIFSTVAFFGVIIGTLYAYYMRPHRRPSRELIGAIQDNLGELENLSKDELEALKETTVGVVNAQINRLKKKS